MTNKYEKNPLAIEQQSFEQIRELLDLEAFDPAQQQVVMRIVHSLGLPEVATAIRFSDNACESGMLALKQGCRILCDVEMVKQGLTKRLLKSEPLCYLNDQRVPELARKNAETRSMAAIEFWKADLDNNILLIGNAPTALFRLLEVLEQTNQKPALIIGMPVGFVGAQESKQFLWESHKKLGVECITLLGRQGGSAVTSASCNALLRCINGQWF